MLLACCGSIGAYLRVIRFGCFWRFLRSIYTLFYMRGVLFVRLIGCVLSAKSCLNQKENYPMFISMIKPLLPRPVKRLIIDVLARCQYWLLRVFSVHPWLSSVYYLFSRRFGREHQAVLKGRLAFVEGQGLIGDSHTLLRRNIHRIEKGLIMRPRKPVFALDYIEPTVDAFAVALANPDHNSQELRWACDVLKAYFKAVDSEHPKVLREVKPRFLALCGQVKDSQGLDVPYPFADKVDAGISIAQFEQLCIQRRSVRWFSDKSVDMSLIEQAVACSSLAPSACNRQPYHFYVANDKTMAQKLVSIPMGTKGFAQNVPCTIVVCADLACYPTERDRHLIYIDSALAAMQLMLALETLGLSTCPINWPDIEPLERQMAKTLDLPATVRPVMLIALGFALAQGQIPFSQKKSPQQLIKVVKGEG